MTRTEAVLAGAASDEIRRYAERIGQIASQESVSFEDLDIIARMANAILLRRDDEVAELRILLQPAALEAA